MKLRNQQTNSCGRRCPSSKEAGGRLDHVRMSAGFFTFAASFRFHDAVSAPLLRSRMREFDKPLVSSATAAGKKAQQLTHDSTDRLNKCQHSSGLYVVQC